MKHGPFYCSAMPRQIEIQYHYRPVCAIRIEVLKHDVGGTEIAMKDSFWKRVGITNDSRQITSHAQHIAPAVQLPGPYCLREIRPVDPLHRHERRKFRRILIFDHSSNLSLLQNFHGSHTTT